VQLPAKAADDSRRYTYEIPPKLELTSRQSRFHLNKLLDRRR
jgi:hypothetical protein